MVVALGEGASVGAASSAGETFFLESTARSQTTLVLSVGGRVDAVMGVGFATARVVLLLVELRIDTEME